MNANSASTSLPSTARRTRPLRHELMLLVGLGLLPLALFAAWGIASTLHRQSSELAHSTLELSRALATAVDAELDATVAGLSALSHARALEQDDLQAFYDDAQEQIAARPEWAAVILTDDQGRVLLKTSVPFGTSNVTIVDPASLQRAIGTRAVTVGSLLPGHDSVYALPVRVPVFRRGELAYVLTAAVKPDRFVSIVSTQAAPEGWIISVFDGTGRRVARSRDQERTVGQPPGPSLAALFAQRPESGVGVTRTIEGDEVFTGYTRLDRYGWTVAVGASTSVTTAAQARSFGLYAFGVALSVLAFGALALRIARRVEADIGRLRDQAVRVGAGESVETLHSDIAEIDEMAVAVHAASERIASASASAREALVRADAASRTKDDFLAMLGHELRNPLAPMQTALHLLDARPGAGGERERQILHRQINHMRRLVDDLLDISRIVRGMLQIRRAPVELRNVVERAVEAVQAGLAPAQHEIELALPADAVWVEGDETRLEQAVTNLLANGVRFGGAHPLAVSVEADGSTARVRVTDRGAGLRAEELARVFEPFYQAPQSLARTSGGLGLGLAIVKTLAELHGGRVTADSAGPGSGSTFEIELPACAAPAAVPEEAPAERAAVAGRVLVVDDNADSATTIAQLLAAASGHEVRVAASAEAALDVFPEFAPQVAILDIGLPDMDGYALARRLREAGGWRGKLIALTGYGQEADKALAHASGFDLHFTKPADPGQLVRVVDECVLAAGSSNVA
jgi:signal transduction histidine kinase/ActR/RegA family two-component response regulator